MLLCTVLLCSTSASNMWTWFLLALMISVTISSPTSKDVKDVYTHIFNGYDKRIRPVLNQSAAVSVRMDFKLNSINEFDEKSQKLVLAGWFYIIWTDAFLTWNMSDFGNVSHVYVQGNSIWLPNIALVNTFGKVNLLSQLGSSATINAKGEVEWFPGDSFVVTCEVDITYYPFDTQHCSMAFEIWDGLTSEVTLSTMSIDFSDFEETVEWALLSSEIQDSGLDYETEVSSIIYSLHLQRRPKFVVLTTIAPIVLLAFLNVCVFLIPLSSGEKNSFCVTVYLSYAVFMGTISSELPHNSWDASYLTIYILALLVFSVTIVLITVIQVRLFIEYGETPVPASILKVFGSCAHGKVSHLDINDSDSVKNNKVETFEDTEVKQSNRNETRVCVKDLLPRLDVPLFWLFLVILSAVTSVMGAMTYSHSL